MTYIYIYMTYCDFFLIPIVIILMKMKIKGIVDFIGNFRFVVFKISFICHFIFFSTLNMNMFISFVYYTLTCL